MANLDICDKHMYCKLIKIQVIFLLLIKVLLYRLGVPCSNRDASACKLMYNAV